MPRAPLNSQTHQGTSLFTSAATNQRGRPKGSPWKFTRCLCCFRFRHNRWSVQRLQVPSPSRGSSLGR